MATDKNFIVKHGLEVGGVNIVDSSGILSQSLITSVPSGAVASTQSVGDSSTALATTAYVRGEIDALINSAPGTLNTLDELAAAINDDAAFNTTLTNAVALKAPLASPTFTGNIAVGGTVDGRDLATDGTKLDGVEASADVTDTANVTSSGALMDSEVTNLAQVKAFDSSDYATAAQGTTADAALPKAGGTLTGNLTLSSTTPTVDIIAGANEDASLRIRENGTGIVGAELIYDGGVNEFQFKIGNNSANTAFTIARDTGQTTFAQNATFSGNVGIGTNIPVGNLHIVGGDGLNGSSTIGGSSNEFIIENNADAGMTFRSGANAYGVISFADPDDHNTGQIYYRHLDNKMTFVTNDAVQMTVDSAGTVDVANDLLANNAKLKAIAASNTDTAVDVFVYDTRKDSDGGAWRKRTQNTSWYNEALNTATRGARKEFPSVAVIVALETR